MSTNQTKANEVQQNESKATERNNTKQDSQILHSFPLWHRDTKKGERTPTTHVVVELQGITSHVPPPQTPQQHRMKSELQYPPQTHSTGSAVWSIIPHL